jgi:hypothetical protein
MFARRPVGGTAAVPVCPEKGVEDRLLHVPTVLEHGMGEAPDRGLVVAHEASEGFLLAAARED